MICNIQVDQKLIRALKVLTRVIANDVRSLVFVVEDLEGLVVKTKS